MSETVEKLSLKTIGFNLAQVVALGQAGYVLFEYATDLMDATQKAYKGVAGAGVDKKQAVMAAVTVLAKMLIRGELTQLLEKISAFIDSCKTLYNQYNAA